MRVETQIAYILHKRPFRDTSQIIDVFTREHGRISLMSRGSRGAKSKSGGLLQIFRPLLIGWQGRGEMPFLNSVEMADIKAPLLSGKSQMSAMYLNELLVYLLHRNDVHTEIFDRYHACLYALKETDNVETVLRLFEKELLQLLGFGLNLVIDADSGEPVYEENCYAYHFEHGPVLCDKDRQLKNPIVSGESLIAFNKNEIVSAQQRSEIKQLMRFVLSGHLGRNRLKSRELFRKPKL
jgi:DNA repair protein RecO (recombination protein O)